MADFARTADMPQWQLSCVCMDFLAGSAQSARKNLLSPGYSDAASFSDVAGKPA